MNRALCIGINRYRYSPLSWCAKDANDWAEAWRVRDFEAHTLLDADATKANILRTLAEFVLATRSRDTLVVTYSGHGTWVPDEGVQDERDGRDEAWCPYDVDDAQLILDDELREAFDRKRRGARVILISDSCHSGTVNRLMGPITAERRRARFLAPGAFLRGRALKMAERAEGTGLRQARYKGDTALSFSACLSNEVAWETEFGDQGNGAFTRVAIDALAELPESASYAAWHQAVRLRLPSVDYVQNPALDGEPRMKRWPVFA